MIVEDQRQAYFVEGRLGLQVSGLKIGSGSVACCGTPASTSQQEQISHKQRRLRFEL